MWTLGSPLKGLSEAWPMSVSRGAARERVDGNHSVHIKVMAGLEIQGRHHLGMEDGKILNLVPQDLC